MPVRERGIKSSNFFNTIKITFRVQKTFGIGHFEASQKRIPIIIYEVTEEGKLEP
jgi:hypothetical protein